MKITYYIRSVIAIRLCYLTMLVAPKEEKLTYAKAIFEIAGQTIEVRE